jgi:short chain dehydrogenase
MPSAEQPKWKSLFALNLVRTSTKDGKMDNIIGNNGAVQFAKAQTSRDLRGSSANLHERTDWKSVRGSSGRPKPPERRYRTYSVRHEQQGAIAMSGTLEAKVAPLTGGSSGIGLATAKRFVAEGSHVYPDAGQQNSKRRRKRSPAITGIQCDVAKLADLDRLP